MNPDMDDEEVNLNGARPEQLREWLSQWRGRALAAKGVANRLRGDVTTLRAKLENSRLVAGRLQRLLDQAHQAPYPACDHIGCMRGDAVDGAGFTSHHPDCSHEREWFLRNERLGGQRNGPLRERLAALAHEQWSGWMRHLFGETFGSSAGEETIPRWAVERWERQIATPYAELSEAEKDSDRKEADRVLALLTGRDRDRDRRMEEG